MNTDVAAVIIFGALVVAHVWVSIARLRFDRKNPPGVRELAAIDRLNYRLEGVVKNLKPLAFLKNMLGILSKIDQRLEAGLPAVQPAQYDAEFKCPDVELQMEIRNVLRWFASGVVSGAYDSGDMKAVDRILSATDHWNTERPGFMPPDPPKSDKPELDLICAMEEIHRLRTAQVPKDDRHRGWLCRLKPPLRAAMNAVNQIMAEDPPEASSQGFPPHLQCNTCGVKLNLTCRCGDCPNCQTEYEALNQLPDGDWRVRWATPEQIAAAEPNTPGPKPKYSAEYNCLPPDKTPEPKPAPNIERVCQKCGSKSIGYRGQGCYLRCDDCLTTYTEPEQNS